MNTAQAHTQRDLEGIDYLFIVRCLARKAIRCRLPAPISELEGLANLAVARAGAYYDPAKAVCTLRQWLFKQGWLLLLSAVRDALRKRRLSVRAITFTDLTARRDDGDSAPAEPVFEDRRRPVGPGRSDQLAGLLAALPESDRGMARMRLGQWTLREIAERYGLSIEAVRQRLRRLGHMVERLANSR